MSPRFVLRRENVPCVAEVVNRSLKADCTDFTFVSMINCLNGRHVPSNQGGSKNGRPTLKIFWKDWYAGEISRFVCNEVRLF